MHKEKRELHPPPHTADTVPDFRVSGYSLDDGSSPSSLLDEPSLSKSQKKIADRARRLIDRNLKVVN